MLSKMRNVFTKNKIGSLLFDSFVTILSQEKKGKKKLLDFEKRLRTVALRCVEQAFDWKSYLSPIKNHERILILGNSQDKAWTKSIYRQLQQNACQQLWVHNKLPLPKKQFTKEFDWVVVGLPFCNFGLNSTDFFLSLKKLKAKRFLLRCKVRNNDFYEECHLQSDVGFSIEKWQEWLSEHGRLLSSQSCPFLQELHCQFYFHEQNSGIGKKEEC